jgi:hypothetical protein
LPFRPSIAERGAEGPKADGERPSPRPGVPDRSSQQNDDLPGEKPQRIAYLSQRNAWIIRTRAFPEICLCWMRIIGR